jgi:glycosyltransferase involved in cell wall biosynthesis
MRLGVYTDYTYRRAAGILYTERAFGLFMARLAEEFDELVLVGKVDPEDGPLRYPMPPGTRLVELPYFASLTQPVRVAAVLARSLGAMWRAVGEVDGVWLLGPHPLGLALAAVAAVRGRRIVLGVRQDFPLYVRARHPQRRWLHRLGDVLEHCWRWLARRTAVITVGPALAEGYREARRLEMVVSLVSEHEILTASPEPGTRTQRRFLSVGRLEEEKNPLLLADILANLCRGDSDWRLTVCGEGPFRAQLEERLRDLQVEDRVDLLGYVAHQQLRSLYREADALLHVSWTEGVPQVLFEAFAARLPVVATDVGGVARAVGGAALLVDPGDAAAAAAALERLWEEPSLRAQLVDRGTEVVRAHTLDAEAARVAAFLQHAAAA